MSRLLSKAPLIVSILATINILTATIATSEPQYGIAMYGKPALPPGFAHLPYANPEAPKGGKIVLGESGGFDSLNPYILKGRAPWGLRLHVVESLMGRNWDEPFGLYGVLAQSIETGPKREWVAFTIRPEAKFSNGTPVTVEDVLWSFKTLASKGHPRYANAWAKVETAEITGPRTVRFTFNTIDRELPLILGLGPILQKADWDGRAFEESSLNILRGSGPYVVADFEPNRFISFKRNPDYWGKDLPFNKGRHNVDEIRYDFFSDSDVVFESFKAGESSIFRENNAGKWDTHYNFPAVINGEVTKSLIAHQRPSGIRGWVMNTRRPQFADIRVRDALIHAFNYEFINRTINGNPQPRITSYYSNSVLGMEQGPATDKVRALLEPFQADLPKGVLDGYMLPVSDGSERNRKNLRKAKKLLQEAGWTVQDGILKDASGMPFKMEVLLRAGSASNEGIMNIYSDALKRLGIDLEIAVIDAAQYKERTNTYDFDMTFYRRALSLSPGNEQKLYWGADGIKNPGTRNYMGMNSPAAEAMIDHMLAAEDQEEFTAAVKALDRILTAGRYVIPLWHSLESRLAHKSELHFPEKNLPMYGDWTGFIPDVWWVK
ncbi:ABC transporter substrate-binding protein [Amylibacter sp. SFDW26]|uniref:extracellular solute-binding protein n=1 Tax=Amylibacter sp. SFDW26 TaxID=2652722 RepID=UPI0012626BBE|nr:extracellular solute-binding protein [Amylibacter sp. SFDW26]KAB7615768.1 ABC transporter substrate-binding protein [Amylibacter sp. SFDW26]